ncbi:TIGR02391 family protein [Catenulispora subtropica]|uniref:TIGR02391 family protein n=2 Tax=Catenulispora subtropica TaxID=450798 RepID=A0ABP5C7W2_9ACTN
MPFQDMGLEADDVVSLPLDDLALRVLKSARAAGERNWQNWLLGARNRGYPTRPDAAQALSEAWAWLQNRGLIAWDVEQSSTPGMFVISRQGEAALDRGLPWIRAVERLNVQMVAELEAKARPQFLRGDFEAAALLAMKEVEVAVRTAAGLENSLVGTALMQRAFRPPKSPTDTGGPLSDPAADGGEAVALMELYKGAIGLFKNPASHRRVDFTDPTEAAEVVLLADLLLRLLAKAAPPASRS